MILLIWGFVLIPFLLYDIAFAYMIMLNLLG